VTTCGTLTALLDRRSVTASKESERGAAVP
jgi:hypothetical protein